MGSYHVEQKRDLKLGEQYAAKCVEYLPTREHGTRLLNVIKDGMVQSSSPQKELSERPDPVGAESIAENTEKVAQTPNPLKMPDHPPASADGRLMTWMEYVRSEKKIRRGFLTREGAKAHTPTHTHALFHSFLQLILVHQIAH